MFSCNPEDFAGVMYCARCSQSWTGAEKPECVSKAHPPITFEEMIEVLYARALDERINQRALIKSGLRFVPDPERWRRVAVLEAAAQLIDAVRGDRDIIMRLRAIAGDGE